jgi:RNA polymerase sigma-70 factor (ECF subfamily)
MRKDDREETPVPASPTPAPAALATPPPPVAAPAAELERLFRTHHPALLRAAYRVTGSLADAEDVLQTVFLRLLRGETSKLREEEAAGYLYRAAVNAALDVVRARARQGRVALDEVTPPASDEVGAERSLASRDLTTALRQALADVSPKAAEMFVLRYVEDLPNGEIARLLGTSQGVVAVLLHRTRTRIKKELAARDLV